MKRIAILVALALVASTAATGCVVRTRTGHGHHGVHGHPASHRHDHCHERGGKHHKLKCHSHPHGPGHH